MKSAAKVLFALALFQSLTYARTEVMEGEKIIGVEISSSQIEADTTLELNHESDDVAFALRLGAQNETWRSMISFGYYDASDDDQEYFTVLGTVDYKLLQKKDLTPYIGLNAGYIDYTTNAPYDDSGFLYGGQLGIMYRFNDNVQADIGYRYSFCESDNIDHIDNIYVGIAYMFK